MKFIYKVNEEACSESELNQTPHTTVLSQQGHCAQISQVFLEYNQDIDP